MNFATRALATLALAAAPAAVASADVLYTRYLESTLYISPITDPNGTYQDRAVFRYGGGPKSKPHADLVAAGLFDVDFTPQSVGQTWTSTAASDPDFAPLAAILTNGVDDATFFRLEGYKGAGYTANATIGSDKSLFFALGATDLAGYTLSSISLRLDALKIDDNYAPNPANPSDTGRQFTADYTLTFEGQPVPEPTAVAFLGALAAPALIRRRRK